MADAIHRTSSSGQLAKFSMSFAKGEIDREDYEARRKALGT
jgi:hypothetical protein